MAQLRAPALVRTGPVRGNEEVISDLCKGGKSWGTTWPNWGELHTTPIACQAEKVKVASEQPEDSVRASNCPTQAKSGLNGPPVTRRAFPHVFFWHGMKCWPGARGVSTCDSYRILYESERYTSKDGRPTTRCRLDGQFSVYQMEPLAHADQAYPPTIHRVLPIEPDS